MNHVTVISTNAPPGYSSQPTATTAGRAIHQMLAPFSVAYFTAALVTDNRVEQLGAMLSDGAGNIRLYKANAAVYVAGACGSTGQALLEILG